jgi:hypothetical protein
MEFPTTLILRAPSNLAPIKLKFQSRQMTSFSSNQDFQQPLQLSEVVTPQPLIVSRCANNRWKAEKPLYIFYVEIHVIFWSYVHQKLQIVTGMQSGQI